MVGANATAHPSRNPNGDRRRFASVAKPSLRSATCTAVTVISRRCWSDFRARPGPGAADLLGDLICRGPSSLRRWHCGSALARCTFRACRPPVGNHEQLLRLSIGDAVAQAAYAKWTANDGMTFIDELRRETGRSDAPLTRDLLLSAAGPTVVDRLDHLQSHV